MPSHPTNLELDLVLRRSFPQLLPMDVLRACLGRDYVQLVSLVDSGRLRYAWNIATSSADRRDIRVAPVSLRHFVDPSFREPDEESVVLESMLPATRQEFRSPEVVDFLLCSQQHLANLISDGLITGLNQGGPGVNGYVRIPRASIVSFLLSRRV